MVLGMNSGNDLLSRKLDKHYHRRCGVSLPCSGWERVGPPRKNHQTIEIGLPIPRCLASLLSAKFQENVLVL